MFSRKPSVDFGSYGFRPAIVSLQRISAGPDAVISTTPDPAEPGGLILLFRIERTESRNAARRVEVPGVFGEANIVSNRWIAPQRLEVAALAGNAGRRDCGPLESNGRRFCTRWVSGPASSQSAGLKPAPNTNVAPARRRSAGESFDNRREGWVLTPTSGDIPEWAQIGNRVMLFILSSWLATNCVNEKFRPWASCSIEMNHGNNAGRT
jgi:hypothetical protein